MSRLVGQIGPSSSGMENFKNFSLNTCLSLCYDHLTLEEMRCFRSNLNPVHRKKHLIRLS